MKKKVVILITTLILITAVAIPVAMATDIENDKATKFFDSMFDFHKKWVDKALDKGDISEEEAQEWNEHFSQMEEYHKENGISDHCGGTTGNSTYNQSYRSNSNSGMMQMY